MHGIAEPTLHAPRLARAGFSTVVVRSEEEIDAVADAGLHAWLCGGGFPLVRDDPSVQAVGIDGRPHVWFNSASPCAPEVREASLDLYRRLAATDGVEGVLVDGCRFASPASGIDAFLTDFSSHARARAAAYGLDIDRMARDLAALRSALVGLGAGARRGLPGGRVSGQPAAFARVLETALEYPGALEWLSFRRRYVTEHFRAIAQIVHAAGKQCGAYVFAPGLAPIVGQSYSDLAGIVDVVAPMLYRAYRHAPGIAALNHELASLAEALNEGGGAHAAEVVAAVAQALGYADAIAGPDPDTIRRGLDPTVIGTETARARAALGDGVRLVPIIQLDDPERSRCATEAVAAGADAVNHFVFEERWEAWLAR